jgi:hypothetical protein
VGTLYCIMPGAARPRCPPHEDLRTSGIAAIRLFDGVATSAQRFGTPQHAVYFFDGNRFDGLALAQVFAQRLAQPPRAFLLGSPLPGRILAANLCAGFVVICHCGILAKASPGIKRRQAFAANGKRCLRIEPPCGKSPRIRSSPVTAWGILLR